MIQSLETSKACDNIKTKKYTNTDIYEIRTNGGTFVLISFRRIVTEKVFPFYYTRQQIEQGFDVCKNNTKMLPFRTQT